MDKEFVVEFPGEITVVKEDSLIRLGVSKSELQGAKANMLVPETFDTARNIDVLPVVFNLAVVNQFNLNGDGINTATAIDALEHFKNKPINIEHKKDQIVGHIINASFSEKEPDFHERDIEEFRDKDTPFFITAAGLIYAHVYPDLAEAITDASNPSSFSFKSISASWEVAFGNFDIVLGTDKDLKDGRILDHEEKEKQKNNLKAFGGNGRTEEGKSLSRLIKSPAYPLGAALTLSPAARVKGVFVGENLFPDIGNAKENAKEEDKSSHLNKTHVRKDKSHIMDEEQFNKLLSTVVATLEKENVSEANQQSLLGQIRDALQERSKAWEEEKGAEKAALAAKDTELKEAQDKLDAVERESAATKAELDQLKSKVIAQDKSAKLQLRMKLIEDKFDLSEKESEIVAAELINVGDEEGDFEKYNEKINVIFAHKNKESLAEQKEKKVEDKTEEKEEKKDDDKELDTNKASTKKLPNSNKENAVKPSLYERVKKDFSVSYSGQKQSTQDK